MTTKTSSMTFSELLTSSSLMSLNIKLNAAKVGRYGLDMPAFTDEMDADVAKATGLNQEQEHLKSELKLKTEALNLLNEKLTLSYALAKKTVKLAETQPN